MDPGPLVALAIAYLLGSVPSAVLVSRRSGQVDIRQMGDGNMGARNVARNLGWKAGAVVACMDVGKGVLAVLLASRLGMDPGWRLAAAFAVVLGHDFPIFAGFRGGQGFATTVGALLVLAPRETIPGLILYGLLYLLVRNSDSSAGIGIGAAVMLMIIRRAPAMLVVGVVVLILSIPAKMLLDKPRHAQGTVS